MHHFSYNEIVEDSPTLMREHERKAMDKAIEMLRLAQEAGPDSRAQIDAFYFLHRLWGIFISDLTNPDNELPQELRAGLISIGIWVNKEIDRVRSGGAADLAPLIEINEIVRDGLK